MKEFRNYRKFLTFFSYLVYRRISIMSVLIDPESEEKKVNEDEMIGKVHQLFIVCNRFLVCMQKY